MSKSIPLRRRSATSPREGTRTSGSDRSRKSDRPKKSDADHAPTCEAILRELADAGVPLPRAEVAARLGLTRRRQHLFDECVLTLERDGRILVNRKGELCIAAKLDLVTLQTLNGRIQVGGEAAKAVATDWLKQNGFLK